MISMNDLLILMVQKKASDLHLTVGAPPALRVDGVLIQTNLEKMTPDMCQRLIYSLLSDVQKQRFESENELDISFGIKGLGRVRMNVFRQRGSVGAALRSALQSVRPPVAAAVPANAAGGNLAADVERVLAEEINPSLAGHGGRAELDGLEGRVARIRFVGGCQGCGAAQLTLAHGVRRTLLDRLPALSDVRDVTDHAAGQRPYYPSGASGASPFPS
jgi:Fe-S cluster biogenesis protein NfuA